MTLNVTRGGLVPAKITNLNTNAEVKFMFNPFEYTISKSVTWQKQTRINENLPQVTFEQGGAPTLSLTLHFDTLGSGRDVRVYTAPLWKMTMVDTTKKNPRSDKGSPPPVAFSWGRLYFKAVITKLSESFTVFAANGTPLRSKVTIDLEQILDIASPPPQDSGGTDATNGTGGGGGGGRSSTTVVQGDRMDHIAARSTGSANNHRQVAEANNIDNPMKVKNGKNLKTP